MRRARSVLGALDVPLGIETPGGRQTEVVAARIHLDPGESIFWHAHPGPTIGVVSGDGTLSIVRADDCSSADYAAGDSFLAPETVHTARNDSDAALDVQATFVVPAGAKPTVPEAESFTACGY